MLTDFYVMLPELYGINGCTLNAHSLTHLAHYVRLWGPLWTQSLFGFESMNGHMVSMLHSKRKLAGSNCTLFILTKADFTQWTNGVYSSADVCHVAPFL